MAKTVTIGSWNSFLIALLVAALAPGCGTLWRIPAEQVVVFDSRPPGANVRIVDLESQEVYATATTPGRVSFKSSPWRRRKPHRYICAFTLEGRVPVEVPLECYVTNGMHFLWTVGYPIGLVSACVDSLCGAGSCRFQPEVKVRLYNR